MFVLFEFITIFGDTFKNSSRYTLKILEYLFGTFSIIQIIFGILVMHSLL